MKPKLRKRPSLMTSLLKTGFVVLAWLSVAPHAHAKLYSSDNDPYKKGALDVSQVNIRLASLPRDVTITVFYPSSSMDKKYAVLFFSHGFLLKNIWYKEILTHLASHGFVLVAPQLHAANGMPMGKPNVRQEADLASKIIKSMNSELSELVGQIADFTTIGLIGHSRGGKVIWKMMLDDHTIAKAIAGIDPIDGTNDGSSQVATQPFPFSIPSLIIGTGLGPKKKNMFFPACAPAGQSHKLFYRSSGSPAWHIVALDYGHLDLLDDNIYCGAVCSACPSSSLPKAQMRQFISGTLSAFFITTLQKNSLFQVDRSAWPLRIEDACK